MIFMQKPEATHVAGFNRWKSLGRCVKKGKKGIAIFAPCKYRIKSDSQDERSLPIPSDLGRAPGSSEDSAPKEEGHELRGFRILYVFDIS